MPSMQSIMTFQLRQKLTTSGLSVLISNDIFSDTPCVFQNASVVLQSLDGKTVEMTVASAVGGTLTFTTLNDRGLTQADSKTNSAALRKERGVGTVGYVTLLAFDTFDRTDANPISGSIRFVTTGQLGLPTFVSTAARDAVYTSPQNGDKCFVIGTGEQFYGGGTWNTLGVGSPVPNASTTVAGIVQEATLSEIGTSTQTGTTGARLFVNPGVVTGIGGNVIYKDMIPRLDANGLIPASMLNNPLATFTIVAPSGGDFTTVTAAINAGAKAIFVKAGTYVEPGGSFNGLNGIYVLGEGKGSVTLNFTAPFLLNRHIALTNTTIKFEGLSININLTDAVAVFASVTSGGVICENCDVTILSTGNANQPGFIVNAVTGSSVKDVSFAVTTTGSRVVEFGSGSARVPYYNCRFTGDKSGFTGNGTFYSSRISLSTGIELANAMFLETDVVVSALISANSAASGGSIQYASGLGRTNALSSSGDLILRYVEASILDFTGGTVTIAAEESLSDNKITLSSILTVNGPFVRIIGNNITTNGNNIAFVANQNVVNGNKFTLGAGDMNISTAGNSITGNTFFSINNLNLTIASANNTVISNTGVAGSIVDTGTNNITAAGVNPLNT